MGAPLSALWTIVAWLVLGFGRVGAAPEASEGSGLRVAVLPLVFDGGAPSAAAREKIEAGVVEGLSRGDIEAIPSTEVTAAAPEATGCADAACYGSVGERTSASHVVRTVVEVGEREYDVMMELVDASNGTVVATSQGSCDICGVAEAAGSPMNPNADTAEKRIVWSPRALISAGTTRRARAP